MHTPRSNSPFFVFTVILMVAMAVIIFGSTPNVQAQDINTPTPEAQETATPIPEVQATVTPTSEVLVQETATPIPDAQVPDTVTPTSEVEAQIIGGAPADPGEYPWQVALVGGSVSNLYTGQFCGGSLIHSQWVLTAGHCVTEDNGSVSLASSIDIVAGIWDLNSPESGFQRKDVIQIIRHPSYNGSTFNNDIALLKLASPVTIGDGTNPPDTKTAIIPLVPANIGSLAGVNSQVTGWGRIVYNPPDWDTELYEVQLPIISNSACNASSRWGGQITSNMLCAGSDAGTKSSCQGDSGGPLSIWNAGTGQWNLGGVTSFGPVGCAVPYAPAVFARVSQFGSWINGYILAPAVLTYPAQSENIGTDYNPVYTWNKVVDVTRYHLYVSGPSGTIVDQWYESSSVCDATTCSVTPGPAATLGGGNYSWYVQTYNSAGYGPWSNNTQPTNFSTTSPTMPAAATNLLPNSAIGTNYNPNYTWDKVATATYYHLVVNGPSGVVIDQWYSSASICPLATCSVPSPTPLAGGNYSWSVQTYNSAGYGPWSNNTQPTNFSTTVPSIPAAAVLTAPIGNIGTNYTPTYTWNKVATATYYHLYVSGPGGVVLDQWYQAATICPAATCSVPSPTLGGGNYSWYVQTYNSAGYGPWSNNTQPTNFSTTSPTMPAAATNLLPNSAIGTNYNPNYTWDKVATATYYHLVVNGPSGVVIDKWYPSASICPAATCSVPSPTPLGGGAYGWYVQTYNSAGYGPWSNNTQPTNFSTTIPTMPVAATNLSPNSAIGTNYNPNYTWDKVTAATYYRLVVNGPSGMVLDQWYQAATICPGATCSVTSPTLGGGNYSWYVQTYNSAGYGPWSNNTQPTNFSTTSPTMPAAAINLSPVGTTASHTPTYQWNKVSMATWYRLYVKGPSGLVKDQWYQAVTICPAATCSVLSPTLESGDYIWWVQSYNLAGYSPWAISTFTVNP